MAVLTAPALGRLIVSTRNFLNSPNPNNSFWTDQELSEYLNDAVMRYFTEISNANEGQFMTKTSLNITTDIDEIVLPSDCFVINAVRKKVSNGYVILNYRPAQTMGYTTQGGTNGDNFFPDYYVRGNNLIIHPVPNYSETAGLELEYMQFPDVMTSAGDTLTAQVPPIFQELIKMYAVYKAKVKESLVNGVALDDRIQGLVSDLYQSMVESVRPRVNNPTYVKSFNPEFDNN